MEENQILKFIKENRDLIKPSGIARRIGITPDSFLHKLYYRNHNKFSLEQIEAIKNVIHSYFRDYVLNNPIKNKDEILKLL